MLEILIGAFGLIFLFIFGLLLGYWIGYTIHKGKYTQAEWDSLSQEKNTSEIKLSELQLRHTELVSKADKRENELRELERKFVSLESDYKNALANFDISKKEWEESKKNLTTEFYNIANKIIVENSERFTNNSLITLENFLKPFKENLDTFSKKIDTNRESQIQDSISLKTEITKLTQMNQTMAEEAQNLTRALKGESKLRGNWGEVLLEKILEASGLEKGIHYRTQETLT
ncbi:MAG: DNA recombination protein RmuC, partial [Leptospiraceae bacterium]|nr:DNA recombination protein RmuC [Leptospiraceae bacterium]